MPNNCIFTCIIMYNMFVWVCLFECVCVFVCLIVYGRCMICMWVITILFAVPVILATDTDDIYRSIWRIPYYCSADFRIHHSFWSKSFIVQYKVFTEKRNIYNLLNKRPSEAAFPNPYDLQTYKKWAYSSTFTGRSCSKQLLVTWLYFTLALLNHGCLLA